MYDILESKYSKEKASRDNVTRFERSSQWKFNTGKSQFIKIFVESFWVFNFVVEILMFLAAVFSIFFLFNFSVQNDVS